MSFNQAYEGSPVWEIGRPQDSFVELEEDGKLFGSILDIGCGTGELTLYLATKGYDVIGVDISPLAIDIAKKKAEDRSIIVKFEIQNALDLSLIARFDTVTDSGVFHVFKDEELKKYVHNIKEILNPNGVYHFIVFSDLEPDGWGPRRISKAEIEQTFQKGWEILEIIPTRFELRGKNKQAVNAWRASIRKVSMN